MGIVKEYYDSFNWEVKREFPYVKGQSKGCFSMYFCHSINGEKFLIKGADEYLEKWLKSEYKIPCMVMKTIYSNIVGRKFMGTEFFNTGKYDVSYSKRSKFKRDIKKKFKFSISKSNGFFMKDRKFFVTKEINSVPKRFPKEAKIFLKKEGIYK